MGMTVSSLSTESSFPIPKCPVAPSDFARGRSILVERPNIAALSPEGAPPGVYKRDFGVPGLIDGNADAEAPQVCVLPLILAGALVRLTTSGKTVTTALRAV
jgi:hypothetical protein